MQTSLLIRAAGRIDKDQNEYFCAIPRLPCSVDLSEAVIFIRPWEEAGEFGADIEIKMYTGHGPRKNDREAVRDEGPFTEQR